MKYHLITYGCQMNTADAQEMAQPLLARGLVATANPQDADIIMMNTCTVREQAEHKADSNIGRLREWKAANPERILIVAGCAATRWGDSIQKKYPFIDLVSPATRIEQFPEAIAAVFRERWNFGVESEEFGVKREGLRVDGNTEPSSLNSLPFTLYSSPLTLDASPLPHNSHTGNWFGDENTAYVTIMRGCNYTCSYCIVPQVRGREKYRPLPDILQEIRQKSAAGQRHVMLLGQTVNSYYWRGSDEAREQGSNPAPSLYDFADLIQAVNALPDVDSIRFMSPHPRHMKAHVIAALAQSSKVSRHIHLPLQSGSTSLLARMKRLYTREEYTDIVQDMRKSMPGLKITTDVIVGFPGETDADFAETVSLLEEIRFDGLFAFKYSPRPGTASAEWVDDVAPVVKDARLQKVLAFSHVDVTA